jgi:ACS family glucarate transporter-like MFS transporter
MSTNSSGPTFIQPRHTWQPVCIIALLFAFSYLSWFNRVSMSVAYDEKIRHETGISETAIGYVYSALLFAYMLCMTPGGWLADRKGPWLALVLMGFGSALFVALTGAVGFTALSAGMLLAALLVIRAAMGVCTAPIYPASGRVIANWLPGGLRAAANGMVMAAALVGIASTYYCFGYLLDRLGWPKAFLVTGAVTALLALVWTCLARSKPAHHNGDHDLGAGSKRSKDSITTASAAGAGRQIEHEPWWALLTHRSLVLLTLSYAAIGYFEYLFYFWMHFYLEDVLHLPKDKSRMYSTILFLAMAAGMLAGGWLSELLTMAWGARRARAGVVVGGMLTGAVFLGLGIMARDPLLIVTCFALALAAGGATEGPFWATAIDLGRRHGGTSAGIFNTGGNAGGMLAPVLTPLVSKYLGWPWAVALGSVVCLAGAALWLWINPRTREQDPTDFGQAKDKTEV